MLQDASCSLGIIVEKLVTVSNASRSKKKVCQGSVSTLHTLYSGWYAVTIIQNGSSLENQLAANMWTAAHDTHVSAVLFIQQCSNPFCAWTARPASKLRTNFPIRSTAFKRSRAPSPGELAKTSKGGWKSKAKCDAKVSRSGSPPSSRMATTRLGPNIATLLDAICLIVFVLSESYPSKRSY